MREQASLHESELMIGDWSGAALEYAFGLERPVLFIDMPQKINNPEHDRIGLITLEESIRAEIGAIVDPQDLPGRTSVGGRAVRGPRCLSRAAPGGAGARCLQCRAQRERRRGPGGAPRRPARAKTHPRGRPDDLDQDQGAQGAPDPRQHGIPDGGPQRHEREGGRGGRIRRACGAAACRSRPRWACGTTTR